MDGPGKIELVGIDPDSGNGRCPGVWVEEDSEDLLLRGKIVNDPLILARLEGDAPSSADEMVVRVPARMREQVAEAATGTYERGRVGHGEIHFHDLLKAAKFSAVHLETRDTYDPSDPAFVGWLNGGPASPEPWPDRNEWFSVVGHMRDNGVRVRRARLISKPVTKYIEWEYLVSDANLEAGEDIRWLVRDDAPELPVPAADYWLIDHRLIIFNTCTGDGAHRAEHYSNDPDVIARTLMWFEQIWERAIPHAKFTID